MVRVRALRGMSEEVFGVIFSEEERR